MLCNSSEGGFCVQNLCSLLACLKYQAYSEKEGIVPNRLWLERERKEEEEEEDKISAVERSKR